MIIFLAAILGFTGVALGAFGAHGLEDRLTPEGADWWDTASFYLLVHAVAAFAAGVAGRRGLMAAGGYALIAGASVFSGTLYAMALGAPTILGVVTPVGGISLLLGWGLIAAAALRRKATI